MKRLLTTCAFAALALTSLPTWAEYPDKPISIIVGYSAGGGTDVMARTVAKYLETALGGASVVIKNEPGAGGQIGFTHVATAQADGYTLGTFNLPAALALTYDRKADYDAGSYTYLANFVEDPNTVVVNASSPYTSLDALVKAAKANPGAITVGLSSLGGNDHFSAIMLENAATAQFTLVPFKGAALARTALLGGHIASGTMTLGQTTKYQDQIRVLAVLSDKRSPFRPEVPTAKELGYDIQMSSLRGIVAPKGLPADVQKRLQKALDEVNANPEFQELMAKQGNPIAYMPSDVYTRVAKTQSEVAKSIWEKTPWK